jgi:transcriptional regulator with XRE-family HTH domain
MQRDKKGAESVPMELREVIAQNIEHYIPKDRAEEVAKLAGINPKTITRLRYPRSYEKHGPTLGSLVRLAAAIGIEPWEWLRPRGTRPILSGKEIRTAEKTNIYNQNAQRNHKKRSGKT